MDFPDKKEAAGLKNPSYMVEVLLGSGVKRTFRFGNVKKEKVYLASDQNKDVYLAASGVISQMDLYFNSILTPVVVPSMVPVKK